MAVVRHAPAGRRTRAALRLLAHGPRPSVLAGDPGGPDRGAAVALRRLVAYAQGRGDVRFARCGDVARTAQADPALPVRDAGPAAEYLAAYPYGQRA
ncbi:hypothetical protein LHJ74_31835 [Streptomyces sp. N2-109]|uniref:Uncharacterized protein n=1 Tax=Streptomyces gossypii TaxID=2883101 RepID=A0ABT2K3A0_9ACTN|nr:hypothetical protein [Streptomyces gossypii]MCT2594446.1 hypothetical protein [Streptomyces gossypii]